MLKKIAQQNSA